MFTIERHRHGRSSEAREHRWHNPAARRALVVAAAAAMAVPAALATAGAVASRAAVVPGFQPAAASFWSARAGVVLGALGGTGAPGGSALLRTTDTGRTWHKITF